MKLIIKTEKKCVIFEAGYIERNRSNISIDGSIAGNPAVCTIYGERKRLDEYFKNIMEDIDRGDLSATLLELEQGSSIEVNIGSDDLFSVEINLKEEE